MEINSAQILREYDASTGALHARPLRTKLVWPPGSLPQRLRPPWHSFLDFAAWRHPQGSREQEPDRYTEEAMDERLFRKYGARLQLPNDAASSSDDSSDDEAEAVLASPGGFAALVGGCGDLPARPVFS